MRRRAVISGLATGAASAIAGCVGVGGGCVSGTDVDFERVDADAIASDAARSDLEEFPSMTADLAVRTLDGETPVVEVTRRSPLEWLTYVDRDGRFYELVIETVAKGEVTGPEYELSRERDGPDDVPPDEVLSFAALPQHDRWRLNDALGFEIEHLGKASVSTSVVAGYLEADDRDASKLAAGVDASFLGVDGAYAALERVGDGTETTRRVRHVAEPIADDADAFADHVLERRGAAFPEPSDELRAFLEEVRENDGHVSVCDHELEDEDEERVEATRREAVAELEATLTELEAADDTPDRIEYVRYDGEWYRIRLSAWAV